MRDVVSVRLCSVIGGMAKLSPSRQWLDIEQNIGQGFSSKHTTTAAPVLRILARPNKIPPSLCPPFNKKSYPLEYYIQNWGRGSGAAPCIMRVVFCIQVSGHWNGPRTITAKDRLDEAVSPVNDITISAIPELAIGSANAQPSYQRGKITLDRGGLHTQIFPGCGVSHYAVGHG